MYLLMSNLSESGKNYIFFLGIFMVLYLVVTVFYMKHKKSQSKNWEEQNPEGSKIYIKSKTIAIKSNGIYIHSVDGEYPATFVEGMKTGLYVLPGNRVIEATYTTTRPGVLYKSVTTSLGPVKVEVEVLPKREYTLSFDEKNQQFLFEEN